MIDHSVLRDPRADDGDTVPVEMDGAQDGEDEADDVSPDDEGGS